MRKFMLIFVIMLSVTAFGFVARSSALDVQTQMLVTAEWLAENLDNPNVIIVHVADNRENYDKGHIPGAQFLAWDEIAVSRDGSWHQLPTLEELTAILRRFGFDKDDRVILYGEDEGRYAARTYVTFDYLGLGDNAALLDGQWNTWNAEGRPVSTEEPAVEPSSFELEKIRPEVMINLDYVRELTWMKENVPDAPITILDVRGKADYTGEKGPQPEQGIIRAGHIPGAVNVPWKQDVVSTENPVMLPAEELRKMYEEAGVSEDGVVVASCQSGTHASHTYFALKYLGYKPFLYDGSFVEWNQQEDLAVHTGLEP